MNLGGAEVLIHYKPNEEVTRATHGENPRNVKNQNAKVKSTTQKLKVTTTF